MSPMAASRRTNSVFFFVKDTATTEIYTLSLHDALPISSCTARTAAMSAKSGKSPEVMQTSSRSEEHTSELQSRVDLVCRLLLEHKKGPRFFETMKMPLLAGRDFGPREDRPALSEHDDAASPNTPDTAADFFF